MRSQSRGARIGNTVKWLAIVALGLIALAYFGMPVRSQERPGWQAELWALGSGERLVAAVRSHEPDDAGVAPTLAVSCGPHLRYDPGPDADPEIDWTGRGARLTFDFGGRTLERDLVYEANDAMFATALGGDDALLDAIMAGAEVTVRAPAGRLPVNTFSLAGSTAAIGEMRRSC